METMTEANWTRWTRVVEDAKFHQFWFEKVDINAWYDFAETYVNSLIVLALIVYPGSIWWLKEYMKVRDPFRLRIPLFIWNTFVSLFSVFALHRLSNELFTILSAPSGFYRSVCLRENLHMSTAFWAIAICFTKPMLVLDTVFLVLRKKPVDAVHMIHHTTAFVCAPLLIRLSEPFIRWMGLANLLVHSIDYFLLALRALKISVPKSRHIMMLLEVLQILFVLFLSGYTLFLRATGAYCIRHPQSVLITYGAFCCLLFFIIITILSPDYWRRGITKKAKQS